MNASTFPQVTELWELTTEDYVFNLPQLCDLQEQRGRKAQNRHVIDDPAERRRKYEIETGIMRDGKICRPLEPWSYPGSRTLSMALYHRILAAQPGEVWLGELDEADLPVITWMRDQELCAVGDGDEILPLSDAQAPKSRTYPGAPMTDEQVKRRFSAYLRDHAAGLVIAAICNLTAGRSVRRSRKRRRRETLTAEGVSITAAEVCAEANRIRSRRADLDGYRYLSLTACRRIIRDLIKAEVIAEISPPRAVRRKRSWRTIPRVIRRVTGELAEMAAAVIRQCRPPAA